MRSIEHCNRSNARAAQAHYAFDSSLLSLAKMYDSLRCLSCLCSWLAYVHTPLRAAFVIRVHCSDNRTELAALVLALPRMQCRVACLAQNARTLFALASSCRRGTCDGHQVSKLMSMVRGDSVRCGACYKQLLCAC